VNRLLVALAFLTRFPIPLPAATDGKAVGRASLLFPAVGLLIGGVQAGVAMLLLTRLPDPIVAVLVVAVGVLLTGALHLDGLADTADGFGGGKTREHTLEIMRDHAVGTYGATAVALAVLLQATTLASVTMLGSAGLRWIVLAPALGRWAPVLLGRYLPYARAEGGLGKALADGGTGNLEVGGATVIVGLAAGLLAGWNGAGAVALALAITILFGAYFRWRLGGVTGDTLGASVVLVEAATLVAAVALQ
jgi:cobalamin 5'-phosphate synthase/cobalamin synthase